MEPFELICNKPWAEHLLRFHNYLLQTWGTKTNALNKCFHLAVSEVFGR